MSFQPIPLKPLTEKQKQAKSKKVELELKKVTFFRLLDIFSTKSLIFSTVALHAFFEKVNFAEDMIVIYAMLFVIFKRN